jgi:hypothetical protein
MFLDILRLLHLGTREQLQELVKNDPVARETIRQHSMLIVMGNVHSPQIIPWLVRYKHVF